MIDWIQLSLTNDWYEEMVSHLLSKESRTDEPKSEHLFNKQRWLSG